MSNNNFKIVEGAISTPKGFQASGIACGIKASGKPDLALIYSDVACSAAAVFTTNKVIAAPVIISKEHIKAGKAKAILINSGNANACTGEEGMKNTKKTISAAARELEIDEKHILTASTGIIGKQLPMDKLLDGIKKAISEKSKEGASDAAQAILTTDTFAKEVVVKLETAMGDVHISGMAKGSGMIEPKMKSAHATMIGVITADIAMEPKDLDALLRNFCDETFNMLSVDGCQSTNDCVFALANGQSGISFDEVKKDFSAAFYYVCEKLTEMIAKDGEGATKLIKVNISGADSDFEAKKIAKEIVNSDLVKSACFGNDPNWGRVLAAAGAAGCSLDENKAVLKLQGKALFEEGKPVNFYASDMSETMKSKELVWDLDLNLGGGKATAWGCDLSYDYVRINAEYRT
jgi:glutamate N-acetyltransferase/amino-acid N-acetyltransferase